MKKIILLILCCVTGIFLSSCAPSVSYVIEIAYTPSLEKTVSPAGPFPVVGVIPFKDERSDREAIGERIRLTGKIDRFESKPSPVSKAVTDAFITALKIHGYRPQLLPEGTAPEAVSGKAIVIGGRIKELWAVARSKPGYTDIQGRVHLQVEIYRPSKKKRYIINTKSTAQSKVVLFSPSDMEKTINDALTDAIEDLLSNKWLR